MTREKITDEVIKWLFVHQKAPIKQDQDYLHFVEVLTDCSLHILTKFSNESSQDSSRHDR